MAGTFIMSLDCEGRWGVAERMDPRLLRTITEESIIAAYEKLLSLFERFGIPVTFAFVMAFTLTEEERTQFADRIRDVNVDGRNWLRFYRSAALQGSLDGWFCPRAFEMVQARQQHEIASHGFTHVPLRPDLVAESDAELELQSANDVARMKGVRLETLVYPRNQVGYEQLVARYGYRGYRERLNRKGNRPRERLRSFARELNLFAPADPHLPDHHGLVRIPAGQIFNWRTSLRAAIPKRMTALRWRSILRSASRTGGVAHLWLHPHNIITGPSTLDALSMVMRDVADFRDRGLIEVVTQREYVMRRLASRESADGRTRPVRA